MKPPTGVGVESRGWAPAKGQREREREIGQAEIGR